MPVVDIAHLLLSSPWLQGSIDLASPYLLAASIPIIAHRLVVLMGFFLLWDIVWGIVLKATLGGRWRVSLERAEWVGTMLHAFCALAISYSAVMAQWGSLEKGFFITEFTPEGRLLTEFSSAYMLADLVVDVTVGFTPIYAVHHVLCIASLLGTNFWANYGCLYIACTVLLGELSNPIQILWDASKTFDLPEAHRFLTLPFTLVYFVIRVIGCSILFGFICNDMF